MDWIHLAQDRIQWHTLCTENDILGSIKGRYFVVAERLSASKKESAPWRLFARTSNGAHSRFGLMGFLAL
jgi:hypothetical protein